MAKQEEEGFNITALLDQQDSFLKNFAKPLFTFYDTLVKEGFSKEQAMEILITYMTTLLLNSKKE